MGFLNLKKSFSKISSNFSNVTSTLSNNLNSIGGQLNSQFGSQLGGISSLSQLSQQAQSSLRATDLTSLTRSTTNAQAALGQIASSVGAALPQSDIRNAVGNFSNLPQDLNVNSLAQNFTGTPFQTGGLDSLVSSAGQLGNLAAATNAISSQIQAISGQGGLNVNSQLIQGTVNSIQNQIGSSISNVVQNTLGEVTTNLNNTVNTLKQKISPFNGFDLNEISNIVGNFGFDTFLDNTINVVAKDAAELFGAIGGEFDRLTQIARQTIDTSGITGEFLNLNFVSPWDQTRSSTIANNSGTSASRLPNRLREHNHFNHIITLGVLTPEEINFPSSYRGNGPSTPYIIRSGGGKLNQRLTVYQEGNEHAEYYIEDLEIDAVIAPNQNTGPALGSTIRFQVIEPYSMGHFLEALISSGDQVGVANYVDATFYLKIEFVGWDEFGETPHTYALQPAYVPITITKVDFNVSGKGSVYEIEAVAASEAGLDDQVQEAKTPIAASGTFVYEILNGDEKSVQSVFNERLQELEEVDSVEAYDRYIITFPKNPGDMVNLINGVRGAIVAETQQLTVQADEQLRREKGLPGLPENDPRKQSGINNNAVQSTTQLFNTLKAYAVNPDNMNEIGLSTIIENTSESRLEKQSDYNASQNEEGDVVQTDGQETAKADKGIEINFSQGEKLNDIITKVLLRSKYAKERSTEESSNGVKKWFKIDTQVFVDKNPLVEKQLGRSPKIYVYSIIPYYADEAKFTGPSQRAKNTEGLKAMAPKEYNYIYTGRNEEVLEFDINFNNAFFMTAFSNLGQNAGAVGSRGSDGATMNNPEQSGSKVQVETPPQGQTEPGARIKEANEMHLSSGSRSTDIRLRFAEQFHNTLLNQTADMITAEMTIWGDPFFLPQQTGNYVGQPTNNPNVTQEEYVNYLQNEVFCLVNFRTPFDYQISGSTMEFPQIVPQFSGLYSIWAVTSSFNGGKFTQALKMIRRRGQDDAPTATTNPLAASDENNIAKDSQNALRPGQTNTAGNSVSSITDPCNPSQTAGLSRAVGNLTASGEDFLMSLPVVGTNSTASGSQGNISIGDFTFTPAQSIFPNAATINETISNFQNNLDLGNLFSGPDQNLINDALSRAAGTQPTSPRPPVNNRPAGPGGNGGV